MGENRERLPFRTKLLYGIGDLGYSMTGTTIGLLFLIYLTDVVGLRPGVAGWAILAGRTWDYLNDPLMGHLSDRTRSRWGRRRPFLLIGFVPFAVAFALMWWRPPIASSTGLALYFAAIYILYDTVATFTYMPYFALTPELTLDYDERTSLTSFRMVFSIVGSLIAFIVPLAIIDTMRPENADRVFLVGILFGIASAVPLLFVFLGTRERPEFSAQAVPPLGESLRAAVRNRPFLFSAGIFLLTWTSVDIVQTMLLYFLKYRLHLEEQSDLIAGTIFVVAMLSVPLWVQLSRRWDKRLAYVVGIAFWASVQIAMSFASPDWAPVVIYTLAGLAGVGVGAAHVLPWSIMPDAVEWDELATGQRHEGMFYSLLTLMQKVASSLALFLVAQTLERAGYVPNSTTQAPSVVSSIQVLTGVVPAVLLCGGILFALRYPLNREQHARLRAELAARRKESPHAH